MRRILLALLLSACGGAAAASVDAGAELEAGDVLEAGELDANAGDVLEAGELDANAGDVLEAGESFCGPTPFSQLRCWGHPDAGTGTSHALECGDAAGCRLDDSGPVWCCPGAP